MNSIINFPKWYKESVPIHHVEAECVLQWPDANNPDEFPVICPVHGIWSRWCLKGSEDRCTCGSKRQLLATSEHDPKAHGQRSIQEILKQIWGGENIPCLLKTLNGGTAADSRDNRLSMFFGEQLSFTPRGPVIVNSHSLRALNECTRRKPRSNPDKLPLGFVYIYLQDMGFMHEWCVVFRSQIRHVMPPDLNIRESYKYVTIYRKRTTEGLTVNVFPDTKCFVTHVDYSQYVCRPDLHYGDEVLELHHCILQRWINAGVREGCGDDVFRLRIRPSPYLKWLNMTLGSCPLITESHPFRHDRFTLQSHNDMGFSIYNGCITSVAVNSPAHEADLKSDHRIVEVNGAFVIGNTDQQIVSLIRQSIMNSPSRSVDLVVLPERFHQQLQSVQNPHVVVANDGFNINSWVGGIPFGLK